MHIETIAKDIVAWRIEKGFKTPNNFQDYEAVLIKLLLIITEVSEASEAVRLLDYNNFKEEMADIIIRTLDLTQTMGIDIVKAIENKMEINKERPHKHGKVI